MDVEERLRGPLWKIDRAKTHTAELHTALRGFFATDPQPYEVIEEINPQTGDKRAWVKVNSEPDPRWALVIGDIIHNLRSALDLLYSQLLIRNGLVAQKSDFFPIHDTEI